MGTMPASATLLRVSMSPRRPWSMVWLLAMLRWVKPCCRSTGRHSGSPRKIYIFCMGVRMSVTGHSRLPTTTSLWAKSESTDGEKRLSTPSVEIFTRTPRSSSTSPVKVTVSVSVACACKPTTSENVSHHLRISTLNHRTPSRCRQVSGRWVR